VERNQTQKTNRKRSASRSVRPSTTREGEAVGTIRGIEESGAYVTTRDDIEGMSIEHAKSGQSFGEAELMWRCTQCGEMGDIEGGLPDTCPNCGSEKEELMYWTED